MKEAIDALSEIKEFVDVKSVQERKKEERRGFGGIILFIGVLEEGEE